ncbi:unnamed protein product [Cylindrotheca closterium]|uniref:Uncharacterized protein n=1 Tax=Cylindrotheca closterium TaxID=2856 RepID=A0AAD2FQQ7_9STRA|nr:unnamed protein product [Cylindrotheca closterium]
MRSVPVEETTFCDSMWACLLNDYGDEDQSLRTEVQPRDSRHRERSDGRQRRSSSRSVKGRGRRSSSRSVSKTRSRSKSRAESRDGHRRSSRRRGSSAQSRVSNQSKNRRRESFINDDDEDSESEHELDRIQTEQPVRPPPVEEMETQIPQAPSEANEIRDAREQVNDEPASERMPSAEKPRNMERKRPEKLTIDGGGDDSPRDTNCSRDSAPGRRDEAPPVLFRSIKNRYNPRSPSANSPRPSPRVLSPVSSPRSPSHLRVDSAEFNTIEDYQKKVLASRDKRSGRKFERIQAIRAKSSMTRADL